jgi:hypothetical protein
MALIVLASSRAIRRFPLEAGLVPVFLQRRLPLPLSRDSSRAPTVICASDPPRPMPSAAFLPLYCHLTPDPSFPSSLALRATRSMAPVLVTLPRRILCSCFFNKGGSPVFLRGSVATAGLSADLRTAPCWLGSTHCTFGEQALGTMGLLNNCSIPPGSELPDSLVVSTRPTLAPPSACGQAELLCWLPLTPYGSTMALH